MSVVALLVLIAVCGVLYWAVGQMPFIAPPFNRIIQVILIVIVAIAVIFWVAALFGYHGTGIRLN